MQNKIGRTRIARHAGRLALAVGLLVALSGCVVYPGGPGYYHPYHACCWYR